jgi:Rieske 2Fe-2S family protein
LARGWLFAGHSCELRNPGDWLTLQLDTDSIIVIRSEDGAVRALHNVCRHRGSQLVAPGRGSSKRIVCPYHQWTYDTSGALTFCRGMHELDKSQFSLKKVHCESVEGLIFISLADPPPPFGPARELMAPFLRPQGFGRAKVAEAGRLRDRRQLEAGMGEQPRVLPLQRQPSAIHQGELGPLQRRRHLRRGARSNG